MKRQKQVAYHEAAHAVARVYVGAPCAPVEINGNAGMTHGTGEQWRSSSAGQYAAWDHALVTLAGPFAEGRISKCRAEIAEHHGVTAA
jgi:ATP-dependent Zn protease